MTEPRRRSAASDAQKNGRMDDWSALRRTRTLPLQEAQRQAAARTNAGTTTRQVFGEALHQPWTELLGSRDGVSGPQFEIETGTKLT